MSQWPPTYGDSGEKGSERSASGISRVPTQVQYQSGFHFFSFIYFCGPFSSARFPADRVRALIAARRGGSRFRRHLF